MCKSNNSLTYKERAISWVESLDDISIEGIESIIFKFGTEVSKIKSAVPVDRIKLKDLEETLQYLNGVIKDLCIDDNEDKPVANVEVKNDVVVTSEYVFDSSPLANYCLTPEAQLDMSAKQEILSSLRKSPHVLKSVNDLKIMQKAL